MEQIKNSINNILGCIAKETANMAMLNSEEFKNACDGVKDLAMTDYYCTITKAMENPENIYGEDWNENGPIKKGYSYNMPSTTHMNSRRGYTEQMYDNMDYTGNRVPMTSRYENARRGYEEHHDMSSLNKIFDVIEEDVKELRPTMSASDRQTAHQRVTSIANMLNV